MLPETADTLAGLGIVNPFPVQALAIPIALTGADVIGQARTGTGKTLAFGLPMLQRISLPGERKPQGLAVVPTRELAIQVAGDIEVAGKATGARVLAVYGGRSYDPQVAALAAGVDIVVGTPGRLLDLARQGHLDLSKVDVLVLDEADEMLDLGFLPDVERILSLTPTARQTMLFSATMPGQVVALARQYMRQPTRLSAEEPDENRTVPTTAQHVLRSHSLDKPELLARILQARGRGLSIVFCQTKRQCDRVAGELTERGFAAGAVHGDLGQAQREQALRAFRKGKVDILVATDVAARGIDVEGVTHVVNYSCPDDEKTYLHRTGRTGRAGADGVAVTFVDWDDLSRWKLINTALSLPFAEPVETYSTSPHLYEELDIPAGVTGVLPRAERTRAGLDAEEVEDLGVTGRSRAGSGAPRGRGGQGRRGGRGEGGRGEGGRGEGGRSGRTHVGRAEGAAPARRPRRRTRNGQPISDHLGTAAPAPTAAGGALDTGDGRAHGTPPAPKHRRRRRSRGAGDGAGRRAPASGGDSPTG